MPEHRMMYGKSTTPITGLSPFCSFAKTSENRHDSREVTFVGAVIEVLQLSQAVSPLKVSAGVIQTLALNHSLAVGLNKWHIRTSEP